MARLKRSVRKEEFWRRLLKEQRRCGLSIRAFCRRKAISEPSFYAWRRELQERDAERAGDGGKNGRLIPVDVIRATGEHATASVDDIKRPLEIATPGGFTLRFGRDTTSDTIARLLDVIARCAPGGAASC
jgi:transposase-like protein